MDELNLSLTPSSLHAPSFLFDSPNAVVNAPSFLLPTEYSPYRESVVLPEMPHSIRRRLIMEKLTAVFSCNTGLVVVTSNTNPFEKSRNAFKCLSTISTLTISG